MKYGRISPAVRRKLTAAHSSIFHAPRVDSPHRLQRVCDLLWRLPKLDVPFAVQIINIGLIELRDSETYSW